MAKKSPFETPPPSDAGKEEASDIEKFRARRQEHREREKTKKREKKEKQESKREKRGEKARERFQKRVSEEQEKEEKGGEEERESKYPWFDEEKIQEKIRENEESIFAISPAEQLSEEELMEEAKKVDDTMDRAAFQLQFEIKKGADLEKIKELKRELAILDLRREHATEEPTKKDAPPSRAATPPGLEEKDEKKEKWPSNVASTVDKAYDKFEKAKHDKNRLSRLQDLQTDVERMTKVYQSAMQHGWPPLPDEESRLLQLKRDIENQLESMAEKTPTSSPAEVHEVGPRKDGEPLAEKKEDDRIKNMKSPEGAPAPEPKKEYTEKDSVEGWKHYIAKEEERMRREKPLTPKEEAEEKAIEAEKVKTETSPEEDRDALKRKLFPEQFRESSQEAKPQGGAPVTEPMQPEQQPQQQPAATAEGAAQESPEMGRAIHELLGDELEKDAQTREAAAAVVGARRAMREALATRKEERLYAEAGAGFIAPERLQEAEQIEKSYENALVGLSARLRESAGNNEEAFLVPYLNIQNAEAMRIAQMREAALTPERRNIAVRFYQRLNNPFNSDVPPRWARYVRVGLTAAVLGGSTAALGGLGAAGIAVYAGWRASKSLAYMVANGIAGSGIDMALTRHADTMMGEERGRQRAAMQEALKNNERIEALQESMRASIRAFQGEAAAQLENRKFYGRAAAFGLMGLSGLVSYELARPSAVAADEGAFGGHIATNEDVLRQRFYGALDRVQEGASATKQRIEDIAGNVTARAKELYESGLSYGESFAKSAEEAAAKAERYVFGGKPSAEVIEDVIGKPSVEGIAGAAEKAAEAAEKIAPSKDGFEPPIWEEAPMGPKFPPEGGVTPHESIEEVQKRMGGGAPRAAEILTDEQREEALKQYYGLVESAEKDRLAYLEKSLRYAPSDEWREEALKRYYGLIEAAEADRPPSLMTPEQAAQLHELQEKGVLTDDQIETLKRNWEGRPPLLDAEEIEKLQALRKKGVLTGEQIDNMRKAWEGKLDALGKEPIATVGKDSNIWEASRSLIGEGEGKISKEQWLEAWEKSGLADKGFVKPGTTVRFDAAEGLLKVSEAKDNEFLYQALVAEGKIKVGEPMPPEYQWLEKARGIEHHVPSPGEQMAQATTLMEARPAVTKETFEEIMRERAAGGATLKEFFADQEAYMRDFADDSLADQEAKIADIERGFEHLRRANELEIKLRPEIREELLGLEKQSGVFLEDLQKHPSYLEHVKAWEALGKEWSRKVGVSETQFTELGNKWSVERFLDTAKKIENRDFVPSDHLSKILEARRMGTLEMAEEIRSKLPDRGALKMPLGRFLKATL